MRTRTQETLQRFETLYRNPAFADTILVAEFVSKSTIVDDVHRNWEVSQQDSGGPLDLNSEVWSFQPAEMHVKDNGRGITLDCPIVPLGPRTYATGVTIEDPSELKLISLGTTAIARCTPTRPSASLSVGLGEVLHDGLPRLVGLQALKEKSTYLRKSGSEYLNLEFGWLPLISDLRKLARSVKSSNKLTTQYLKSSDSKIRRRYYFPKEAVTREIKLSGNVDSYMHSFPNAVGLNQFPAGATTYHERNGTWFSGAFRYHIPLGDDFKSKMVRYESEANKLLGSRLTPEVVWNLAPWSWALDWFGNYGDVIANISNLGLDGMVLQYGYVMNEHVQSEQNVMLVNRIIDFDPTPTYTASSSHIVKHLRRRSATPYGFGFDMTALTASQNAIVVALGLSRGHR